MSSQAEGRANQRSRSEDGASREVSRRLSLSGAATAAAATLAMEAGAQTPERALAPNATPRQS